MNAPTTREQAARGMAEYLRREGMQITGKAGAAQSPAVVLWVVRGRGAARVDVYAPANVQVMADGEGAPDRDLARQVAALLAQYRPLYPGRRTNPARRRRRAAPKKKAAAPRARKKKNPARRAKPKAKPARKRNPPRAVSKPELVRRLVEHRIETAPTEAMRRDLRAHREDTVTFIKHQHPTVLSLAQMAQIYGLLEPEEREWYKVLQAKRDEQIDRQLAQRAREHRAAKGFA